MHRLYTAAVLLTVALLPALAQAQSPAPLFRVVDAAETARLGVSTQRALAAISARRTTRAVRPIRFENIEAFRSRTEGTFEIVSGQQVQLRAVRFAHTAGGFFWAGRSTEGAAVQLSVVGNQVTGTVHTRDRAYTIQPLAGDLYALVELDPSALPADEPAGFEEKRGQGAESNHENALAPRFSRQSTNTGGSATIDVMVVYTSAAAQAAQNELASTIGNVVNWSIQSMNNTFYNSGLSVTAQLVHSAQVTYNESGDVYTDVGRLQGSSDGYMDNVHTLRNTYYADVVVLLTATGNACGVVADIGGGASTAFATSKVDCAYSNYSVAHEIGHLAGARHNNDSGTNPFAYAHGYENTSAGWRTVMAVLSNAYRIPYWSDPDQSYYGAPMGTSSFSDNVRMWENAAATVAAFKSPPPPPDPLSATISGPSSLGFKAGATFTANPSGATGSYTYAWYRRTPPSGGYFYAGCATQTCYQQMGTDDFELRVDVSSGTETVSPTKYVTYENCNGSLCPSIGPADPTALTAAAYSLHEARPNPVSGATQLGYALPERAHVRLAVYDALGREVARLVDAEQEAGTHAATFTAGTLSAGVYLYRLEATGGARGPFTATGRLSVSR